MEATCHNSSNLLFFRSHRISRRFFTLGYSLKLSSWWSTLRCKAVKEHHHQIINNDNNLTGFQHLINYFLSTAL